MATFKRADYLAVYELCKEVYFQTRSDTRASRSSIAQAKELAIKVEECIGQLGRVPAEAWDRKLRSETT